MGNPVSNNLPVETDAWLQGFAQSTGEIDYSDIAAFGDAWPGMMPEKRAAFTALRSRIDAACSGLGHDAGEAMDSDRSVADMCRALAEIVRP